MQAGLMKAVLVILRPPSQRWDVGSQDDAMRRNLEGLPLPRGLELPSYYCGYDQDQRGFAGRTCRLAKAARLVPMVAKDFEALPGLWLLFLGGRQRSAHHMTSRAADSVRFEAGQRGRVDAVDQFDLQENVVLRVERIETPWGPP